MLVLVSIVIVANVVMNIIGEGEEGATADPLKNRIEISRIEMALDGDTNVAVHRGPGETTIDELKFLFEFEDGSNEVLTRTSNLPGEFGTTTFYFNISEIQGSKTSNDYQIITHLDVTPIFGDATGIKIGKDINDISEDSDQVYLGNLIGDFGFTDYNYWDNYHSYIWGTFAPMEDMFGFTNNNAAKSTYVGAPYYKEIIKSNIISLEPGKTYKLSFWAKNSDANGNMALNFKIVDEIDENPYFSNMFYSGSMDTEQEWTKWTSYIYPRNVNGFYPSAGPWDGADDPSTNLFDFCFGGENGNYDIILQLATATNSETFFMYPKIEEVTGITTHPNCDN